MRVNDCGRKESGRNTAKIKMQISCVQKQRQHKDYSQGQWFFMGDQRPTNCYHMQCRALAAVVERSPALDSGAVEMHPMEITPTFTKQGLYRMGFLRVEWKNLSGLQSPGLSPSELQWDKLEH
ncbi:hypothetical protein XENTR_v10009470 [Xenopus tropicalis]|nr:hypothetical protein XENTR_v10009470 [Xenopus tropicalis]